MKIIMGLFLLNLLQTSLFAQLQLTGNLHEDSKILLSEYGSGISKMNFVPEDRKSPVLGGLFSLLVPGAGEFYSENYLKAGIFAGIEAIVITTALIYDSKGDKKTKEFQQYADERWSVVRYAEWLNEYVIKDPNNYITIIDDPSLKPWERVDWNELNAKESGSHTLPPHGHQQYYELIGKYYQYSAGWDDYQGEDQNELMSPNFHFYSGMRGDANDFYNIATKAVVLLYINHFASALDGVWSAIQFNSNLAFNVRVEENYLTRETDFYPTVNFRLSF